MEIFEGPLLLGRIIPILYFLITIPGLVYILWQLIRWAIRTFVKNPREYLMGDTFAGPSEGLDYRTGAPLVE